MRSVNRTEAAVHDRLQELELELKGTDGALSALRLAQERLHLSVEVELAQLHVAVAAARGESRRRRVNDASTARVLGWAKAKREQTEARVEPLSSALPEPPEISVM